MEDPYSTLLRSLPWLGNPGSPLYYQAHAFSYLDCPSFSDAIIQCGDKEFKIHKLVLCAQSKYFSWAFNGEWKESADGAIRFKGDDGSALEAMLQFMYTFDYDASGSAENSSLPMLFNVKVYSIADKYDVLALKSHAKQKFEKAVETCWDMDDFPDAIAQVYNSTPSADRDLRQVVSEAACEHVNELLPKQSFRDALEETVGFASDIAQLLAKRQKQAQRQGYQCLSCSNQWDAVLGSGTYYYCIHCGSRRSDWPAFVV